MNAKFSERGDGKWTYKIFDDGKAIYSSIPFNTVLQARIASEDRFGRLQAEFHGDERNLDYRFL